MGAETFNTMAVGVAGNAADINNVYWFAAYTRARHEKRVATQLHEKAVECFLPTYETVHRWKDRRTKLQLPLFPGYVFVNIAARDRLRVLELPGVVRMVGFNGQLVAVPDQDIERLRNNLSNINAEPYPYLRAGRRVRVKSGPFEGMEGILKHRKNGGIRLILSIDTIMRSVALDIDGAEVEPL